MQTKEINKVLEERPNAVFIANARRNRSLGFPCLVIKKQQHNGRFIVKFIVEGDKLSSLVALEARAFHNVTDQDFILEGNK